MKEFDELAEIVRTLRSPEGCPWDREQNLYSLKSSMMEEAAELLDALDNKDMENIKEELGDLLLHVVMHSQMAEEEGFFSIKDVLGGINEKLIRRHPHVFGEEKISDAEGVIKRWEEVKTLEKAGKPKTKSVLDKIPANTPSLMKAEKLQKRAAKFGFDWVSPEDIFIKLDEEIEELKEAYKSGCKDRISEELGDVIFVMANLGRHMGVEADEALRKANKKFKARFGYIEEYIEKRGQTLEETSKDSMEKLWLEAKTKEKK